MDKDFKTVADKKISDTLAKVANDLGLRSIAALSGLQMPFFKRNQRAC